MAWRRAISAGDLRAEGVKGVEIDGVPVALFRLGDEVFATHGVCTHALAFLAEGFVEDGKIECPLHQGTFDIRTGKALCAPLTKNLQTFAVKVEDGVVFVDLDTAFADGSERILVAAEGKAGSPASADSVVIIGAGQAAAAAVRSLRASGFVGQIDLVGSEAHLPYERPPLSKDVLLGKAAPESCERLSEADVVALNVITHLRCQAVHIDPQGRIVTLSDGRKLHYGSLLLATGGKPRRLDIPGTDLAGVHYLRTIEDAAAIRKSLACAKRLVIVGGGFIGMELASVAASLGLSVVVLEREAGLMARVLPGPLARTFRALAERHGVSVRLNTAVQSITRDGDQFSVHSSTHTFAADAVCIGVGLMPETELAMAAGCEVDGGIVVDAEQKTSVDGIWAAGDCALFHAPVRGRRGRLESWHNAEQQGAAAGRSIAGVAGTENVQKPWFWTDQFGINVQILGVSSPTDKVALTGADGVEGAVYRTIDAATGRLTSVVAFSNPAAIRQARKELESTDSFDMAKTSAVLLEGQSKKEESPVAANSMTASKQYVWPSAGLTRVPDWVYTDEYIYQREVEKIFHGRTWNYVALESEIPNPGDFIRSNVGPTPIVVSRAEDGTISAFENRCMHRAAEFCRTLNGNVKEFVCPYHQWTYDLKGNLAGVPFRRGVDGKGGMPPSFKPAEHGLKRLKVTTHRGVVFASYCDDMEPLADYLGTDVLREFEATFGGRKLKVLGHYRHSLPGNWKLYHENLKDPYHATLLHTFLVTFGLLVAGNKSLMISDPSGRHGVMASAKSDASKLDNNTKKEMRAYKEGMTLAEPRFMDFISEFDSPWSVTMTTIWPNLIVQREMNTLGIRQIVPTGPNEFIMKWTMFGFEGDDEEMTRHRLRQGNLMGPAGFLGLEDNEAIKFVQDGMLGTDGSHVVELDPGVIGTSDTLISEASIRAMYQHWRGVMDL